jgi:hypothetical protein
MGESTIFYSWQSDTSKRTNRNFIEKALDKASRGASQKLHIDLRVDQDSRGEAGSPLIPDTMRRKIAHATSFVADVTIVGARETGFGGLINSNVAIEWGWAGAALGDSAIIGVINEAYGDAGQLPVDLRQQLVKVRYKLLDSDNDEVRAEVAGNLTKRLEAAIVESVTARFFKSMHADAPRVAQSIMAEADDNGGWLQYDVSELAGRANVTEAGAEAVMHDLLMSGLAEDAGCAGSGTRIQVREPFFAYFDPLYKGWSADRDARELARLLVQQGSINVPTAAEQLNWTPRRINPALFRIEQYRLAITSDSHNVAPFYLSRLRQNEATLAFAEGRRQLGPIVPRG